MQELRWLILTRSLRSVIFLLLCRQVMYLHGQRQQRNPPIQQAKSGPLLLTITTMQIINPSVIMLTHHILMMLLILHLILHTGSYLTLKKVHGTVRLPATTTIPEYISLLVAMLHHHIVTVLVM